MSDSTKPNSPAEFVQKVVPSSSRVGKHSFICPNCGEEHGSTIDHLVVGQAVWRWSCDHCYRGISLCRGELLDYVTCTLTNHYTFPTLVLLRMNLPTPHPVHIVVKGICHIEVAEHDHRDPKVIFAEYLSNNPKANEYYYNEHTCPWNYLDFPIKYGIDTDPHGLFVHQETIAMPEGYANSMERLEIPGVSDPDQLDVWKHYFHTLGAEDQPLH